ncbi:hypothetical protein OB919_13485 [Halobacteria archaeon AArc-curdl1]|uniref:Uncharacterized protein n=1 Tax=Natronosalvus hydrolyticus TaxID=2979988 RepID=A0AAP2Z9B4_9EURY|nr:hypothetical protein [Halobacteria archaeon AArc-curdl1]
MLERERLIEIAIALPVVLMMIGAMMLIGENYTTNDTLTAEGGEVLVGAIIGFIFLMLAVGFVLAYVTADEDEEPSSEGDSNVENTA